MFNQKKVAMILAEFFGTATLAMVVYTIIARTDFPLFTGLAAGATVGLMVYIIGSFSEAHLNPALTFGLWSLRKVKTGKAIVYIAAQMLGGLAAWMLTKYFLGHTLTSIAGSSFSWKVFVAEAVGAFILLFGAAAAIYNKLDTGKMALTIGGSFFLGIMVASLASNGIVNPAVAVGIQSWNWAYAVAPLVGAVLGANVFALMFVPIKTKSKKK
jgi:aquaporin Z